MGLPLFVAPIETDLPHKAAGKNDVLSPSRSAIRRPHRPDSRERRNARRAAARMFSIAQPNLPPTTQDRLFPWQADRGLDPERPSPDNYTSRSFRDALDGIVRARSRRMRERETLEEQLEDHMSSIFGGTWDDIGPVTFPRESQQGPQRESRRESQREEGRQEIDLGWWSVEPQPRARRARVAEPTTSGNIHVPDMNDVVRIGDTTISRDLLERLDRATAALNEEGQHRPASSGLNDTLRRRSRARFLQDLRRQSTFQRAFAVDGLGDRDRSLSPEVWDTLLSTLTPDPQPPSAASSFASAVALQGAGPSNALPSAPDPAEETAMDPACESGCENSDPEDPAYEHPDYERIRRRREEVRQASLRAPEYNLDGPSEGPFTRRAESAGPQGLPIPGFRAPVDSWTGVLSAGPSEDDGGADRSRYNREDSAGIGAGMQTGDEEWLGMQRIVRSLADRRDIPDEWWAEAGLSRTLRQDETN